MFNNVGWGELLVLAVLGLLIFGPDRLPKVAADAGRMVRELRRMAMGATADLRAEFGTDLDDLKALDPRSLDPRRMLFEDEPARPSRAVPTGPRLAAGEPAPYDPEAT